MVGAVFGQTEGLLGEDLDLRELQRTGRIGRIQIAIKSQKGTSKGEIVIPVSLNKTATAILAAALETVDRVGPCTAKVTLLKLEDIRGAKRRKVVSRAISILKGWEEDIAPGSEEITTEVTRGKKDVITKYGPDSLPAGTGVTSGKEIIIVEGRADVINLMKYGVNNTIAVEGTHVPKTIIDLTKKRGKTIIAFLDGDRGGDLILRELMQVARVDYIARAPEGVEVENMARQDVMKALQARIPADQALALVSKKRITPVKRRQPTRARRTDLRKPVGRARIQEVVRVDDVYIAEASRIKEAFKAVLFSPEKKILKECGVADLTKTLESQENVDAVVFDGVVTQRLVDLAIKKNVRLLVGAAIADIDKKTSSLSVVTFDDLGE